MLWMCLVCFLICYRMGYERGQRNTYDTYAQSDKVRARMFGHYDGTWGERDRRSASDAFVSIVGPTEVWESVGAGKRPRIPPGGIGGSCVGPVSPLHPKEPRIPQGGSGAVRSESAKKPCSKCGHLD